MSSSSDVLPLSVGCAQPAHHSRLRDRLATFSNQDIVIAVVGYAGSGTSFAISQFAHLLKAEDIEVQTVKARPILESWAEQAGRQVPSSSSNLASRIGDYQDLGDQLRLSTGEYGAVAGYMIRAVHHLRKTADPASHQVYFLDSLKHPAEVELLRQVYGEGFRLIGVACRPDVRQRRLETKFHAQRGDPTIRNLIERDAEDSAHKYGQHVNRTFYLSDYFIDNTVNGENAEFLLPDTLREVFEKFFTRKIFHPTPDERGMYFADAASLGSACLSRQVGAAIVDPRGNLLAVGRNDVPRPNGGLYSDPNDEPHDGPCYLRGNCSNKVQQEAMIDEIMSVMEEAGSPPDRKTLEAVRETLRTTRMGALIEFSRSVHAEMDAMVSLGRTGTRLPHDSTLFTTTYPCHNCARHIVAAGIKRVVYLEPYQKSLATGLHSDSIADNLPVSEVGPRVHFQPYVGVAPRLYQTIYRQSGPRKNATGIALPQESGRTLRSRLSTLSFTELEAECEKFFSESINAQ